MMNIDTVIKNGMVATGYEIFKADIGIKGEKICAIGADLKGKRTIDASNKYVMPAGIDCHVHFQLPFCATVSADDFETGTKAAAAGGITTIIDFAIQKKGEKLEDAVAARKKEASEKVCVDYGLHCAITDWSESTKNSMKYLIKNGIPSFKFFMIYRTEGWMADDAVLLEALQETAKYGGLIMVHAESAYPLEKLIEKYHTEENMKKYGAYCHVLSRPNFIEEEAVQRAIKWCEIAKSRIYIVHVSAGSSAELIKSARANGIDVHAETCPQYLILDDEVFKTEDGYLYATCPQIKKKSDAKRLWEGLGKEIEVVSTDTCTFTKKQKAMWNGDFTKIPYGLPGTETLLPLLFSEGVMKNRISVNDFVKLISVNPAKIFGLYPNKGSLQIGTDADIVVFDPNKKVKISAHNLETNCDWSPYEGFVVKGFPVITLCRGRIVAEDGKFKGEKGYGRFLLRNL